MMVNSRNQSVSSSSAKVFASTALLLFLLGVSVALRPAYGQTIGFERERARTMLEAIKGDVKKNYYDPNFRGIDIDARFSKADAAIKAATSVSEIVTIIAQTLLDFKDSHTYFIPPPRQVRAEYGWQMQMVGDRCYIVAVKPGSDAQAKGLKEGDALLSVNGFKPTRNSLWILNYYYNTLSPQAKMQLAVQSPDGKVRQLEALASIQQDKKLVMGSDLFEQIRKSENEAFLNRHRYYEIGDEVFIWKMPQFDLSESEMDQMMSKVKKRKAFILDMRGNGGGYEITMQRLLGHLFDRDLKIGDLKSRQESKPVLAKTRGANNFKGQLVILIDSRSGSAAELTARVVQLEKRGVVIGDRSSGAVMRSRVHSHKHGQEIVLYYGASITESDLIMNDGKSLEGTGVTPDTILLPTATDIAAKRDPVLAHAASLVGLSIDAEKAGTLFPIEWKK